ncbi:hypothetical protein BDZ94DRAFT_1175629, partial [Collybia nuda]
RESRFADLKKKAQRFRVLFTGGANSGKTTILKKICNTTNDPEIYNREGQKHDYHDIENELIFQDNLTFIFHDSSHG